MLDRCLSEHKHRAYCSYSTCLQVTLAMAAQCKLTVLGFNGEEGGPAIERQNPGAVGTAKWKLSTGWDGACVRKLQHGVFNVADDLMILLQKLLQLLNAVLQHRNLALKLRWENKTKLSLTYHPSTNTHFLQEKVKSAGTSSTTQRPGMQGYLYFLSDTILNAEHYLNNLLALQLTRGLLGFKYFFLIISDIFDS